eukprot:7487309-Karenia_brevis.AAC.1
MQKKVLNSGPPNTGVAHDAKRQNTPNTRNPKHEINRAFDRVAPKAQELNGKGELRALAHEWK